MVDVFDYHALHEMLFLRELAEDLEGTFSVIAYTGCERDIRYIRQCQRYFRERYGPFLEHVNTDVGIIHILPAYHTLQELLDCNPTPDEIIQECENCLYDHLIIGEPSDDYEGEFQEFFEQEA